MQVKVKSDPVATFSHLLFKSIGKMLRGGWAYSLKKSQEGTAVGFLLVWCGRSATTLVAAGHILNPLLSKNDLITIKHITYRYQSFLFAKSIAPISIKQKVSARTLSL
jgi:hypothetical protein